MTHLSNPPRRRRTAALVVASVVLATVAATFGASPASATNASLVTTDGIGIRVDENAILGPALQAIEDELQPFVNQKISEGALANSVMDDPDWADGSANVNLSFDFVNAGSPGYPQGGLKVHADLTNILMRFYRYGAWWQPECLIYVQPDDGTIDASAKIDTTKLPNAPLTLNPIAATWDNDPSAGPAPGYSWLCNGYLIDEWWDGLWGNGTDVAAQLEAELNSEAQDLVDSLWDEHVAPIIDSLTSFGISFNQVRTDDHGLIVTANTDATGGVTLPVVGGTYDVSNTPDAGVTADVNTVLAQRREIITTINPNVVAQYVNALNQALTGEWGQYAISSSVESALLPPAAQAAYNDAGWAMRLTVDSPPSVTPTGTGGAPEVNLPAITMKFFNTSKGPFSPVATFTGTLDDLNLVTEVQSGTGSWGPMIRSTNATLSNLVRTQANVDAAGLTQTASGLQPFARSVWNNGAEDLFVGLISLPPLSIGGLSVNLCTACTRISGDQRYTETFNVA